MTESQTGTTATGVPFVVVPAASADAPIVVAWHLLDPPRTEAAMAAALPLSGFDATKIYLGLPMSGSRTPQGGVDEIMRLGMAEPVMNLHWPIHEQAVAEFPAAFSELIERFGLVPDAPLGLLGGSAGSSVAAAVLASGTTEARAAVFVSPMLQLRQMVAELSTIFEMTYTWTDESLRAADRMDFVARAPELLATGAAIRVVAGADDSAGATGPATAFAAATGADLHILPGLAHALAEEPGLEPAPQTPGAQQVDALAAEWFAQHLR
jgi:hypothetical protein